MVQELITHVWCDVCAAGERQNEGEAVILAIGASASPRRIDLCAPHRAELLTPLTDAFAQYSQPLGTDRPPVSHVLPRGRNSGKPKTFGCLLCISAYASQSGLRSHFIADHHIGGSGRLTVSLSACPICNQRVRGYRELARHAASAHELPTVEAAMLAAADAGDPYEIVKATREALSADADL